MRELNEVLTLDKAVGGSRAKKHALTKTDFETYQRKKVEWFSWQKSDAEGGRMTKRVIGERAASMQEPSYGSNKAIDTMLGFKQ